MSETQPALTKHTSRRVRAALAAAVALASMFGSHVACSETAGTGAALGTFHIVPTHEMARIKGAAGVSSLRLMLPANRPLLALPIEGMKWSVTTLADAIYPHFSMITEGASIAAALRLNVSMQLPDGARILMELDQRVPNTGAPAAAR
jgi:hypothetical protein